MSFLKVGSSNANKEEKKSSTKKEAFKTITPGDYEAVIEKVEVTTSNNGNEMIKLQVTLRNDIDQEFKNRKLWDYVTNTEKSLWRFDQIAKAVQIPDGTNIESVQDFAKAIEGEYVKVSIKQAPGPYNKKVDRISFYNKTTAQ